MFSQDFFPTPTQVIDQMLNGYELTGKTILEPSAGKGNIVDHLTSNGAQVIACESNHDLKKILQTKCTVIADDFLTVTSDRISHIDMIVMNPPFSADEKHLLHAFEIAPAGCQIIALCNVNTVKRSHTSSRQQLLTIIESHGGWQDLGACFKESERSTEVEIALVTMKKPGESYSAEFDGFFMGEEIEEQGYGIMSYNSIRDLVNRYVASIKIYDQQLETAAKLNDLTKDYFFAKQPDLAISVTRLSVPLKRNEFKKEMQKAAWKFVFDKMNMRKYATKGLMEDINKFVEQQQNIPFTMKNIYRMLEIVIGTQSQRMDKALLEVFESLTKHHNENRYNVEGWKTNSHYLVNKRFIFPYGAESDIYNKTVSIRWTSSAQTLADAEKAICYITGSNYDDIQKAGDLPYKMQPGEWYDTEFFKIRAYKKGTIHCEFKTEDLWAKFNQHISRLKGYPLFEPKAQTKYQDRQTGRANQEKTKAYTQSSKLF